MSHSKTYYGVEQIAVGFDWGDRPSGWYVYKAEAVSDVRRIICV